MATTKYQPLSRAVDSIGTMDRRVQFHKLTVTKKKGAEKKSYALEATKWGHVRFDTGAEVVDADAFTAYGRVQVTIYWYADLLGASGKAWKMIIEGVEYNIQHVAPIGRRFLRINAERWQ